jgi:hypothetical protein
MDCCKAPQQLAAHPCERSCVPAASLAPSRRATVTGPACVPWAPATHPTPAPTTATHLEHLERHGLRLLALDAMPQPADAAGRERCAAGGSSVRRPAAAAAILFTAAPSAPVERLQQRQHAGRSYRHRLAVVRRRLGAQASGTAQTRWWWVGDDLGCRLARVSEAAPHLKGVIWCLRAPRQQLVRWTARKYAPGPDG